MVALASKQASEAQITLYWEPGCSGCLRMKEFVEQSGLDYVAINVDEFDEWRARLSAVGMKVPTASVGEKFVNGIDLGAVAELIGVPYEAPAILPAFELVERYLLVNEALCRYIAQLPKESLEHSLAGRSRPVLRLATHAGSVMRAFVNLYYEGVYDLTAYREQPEQIRTTDDLIARAKETRASFVTWWEIDGHLDPLDTVVETHFGYRTTLEVMEREVWHTAQHTRQVMSVVETFGITPNGPLSPADLEGLPLPERVHD